MPMQDRDKFRASADSVYGVKMTADRFLKYLALSLYTGISLYLFNEVYAASSEVIDELFHLGQGFEYCMGNFSSVG